MIGVAKCDLAYSDYTDEQLRAYAALYGPKEKDKLLIPKVKKDERSAS